MDNRDFSHHNQFNEYLLTARLKRVSQENLKKFYKDEVNTNDNPKSKTTLVEEIVAHYQIMLNNSEFKQKFSLFIRDYVLSAKESEHLIEINDKKAFIQWINNWSNNTYLGKNFSFYKHVFFELPEQYLCLDEPNALETTIQPQNKKDSVCCLSFPNQAFLLVAYKKEGKSIFSRDRLMTVHDTREFEIVFRANSPLVSVRGENSVVRDFFSSIVEDANLQLSAIKSLFVGEEQRKSYRPIVKPRVFIKIEDLKQALNGTYLDIDAPVAGDQATRIKISLKGMNNIAEETHPILGPAVAEVWREQEKSRIAFLYNNNTYSFTVTNNGGLYFRQYAPEEVITYVLLKILLLQNLNNGYSSN